MNKQIFEQAPIASIRVRGDGTAVGAQMYAPSLPAGDYDVYIEPRDDMLRAAYMRGRTDEAALNSMPTIASEAALTHAYAEGRKDEAEAQAAGDSR